MNFYVAMKYLMCEEQEREQKVKWDAEVVDCMLGWTILETFNSVYNKVCVYAYLAVDAAAAAAPFFDSFDVMTWHALAAEASKRFVGKVSEITLEICVCSLSNSKIQKEILSVSEWVSESVWKTGWEN